MQNEALSQMVTKKLANATSAIPQFLPFFSLSFLQRLIIAFTLGVIAKNQ
jgi:hypothetical protein